MKPSQREALTERWAKLNYAVLYLPPARQRKAWECLDEIRRLIDEPDPEPVPRVLEPLLF